MFQNGSFMDLYFSKMADHLRAVHGVSNSNYVTSTLLAPSQLFVFLCQMCEIQMISKEQIVTHIENNHFGPWFKKSWGYLCRWNIKLKKGFRESWKKYQSTRSFRWKLFKSVFSPNHSINFLIVCEKQVRKVIFFLLESLDQRLSGLKSLSKMGVKTFPLEVCTHIWQPTKMFAEYAA